MSRLIKVHLLEEKYIKFYSENFGNFDTGKHQKLYKILVHKFSNGHNGILLKALLVEEFLA